MIVLRRKMFMLLSDGSTLGDTMSLGENGGTIKTTPGADSAYTQLTAEKQRLIAAGNKNATLADARASLAGNQINNNQLIQNQRSEISKLNGQNSKQFQNLAKDGKTAEINNILSRNTATGSANGLTNTINNAKSEVGVMEGLKNTWHNAGGLGKAGMIAGGLAAGGLLLKGASSMFGGNDNNK